jgi:hypothetical protein
VIINEYIMRSFTINSASCAVRVMTSERVKIVGEKKECYKSPVGKILRKKPPETLVLWRSDQDLNGL